MPETTRRLAAIAFADVAGWSRLIAQSDVGTLRAWKALQAEVLEPTIRQHRGRLIEIAGDSVLVEFPSAVAAVEWALDVQKQSRDRWLQSETSALMLRVGINVEDVIVDGDKHIFGAALHTDLGSAGGAVDRHLGPVVGARVRCRR